MLLTSAEHQLHEEQHNYAGETSHRDGLNFPLDRTTSFISTIANKHKTATAEISKRIQITNDGETAKSIKL